LALWRLGNKELSIGSYITAFRLSAYIATQFKPQVAKFFYEITNAKTVFDSSCGWGDRLAGFYCSSAKEYYGTDPNDQTFEIYKKQCIEYETLLGNIFGICKSIISTYVIGFNFYLD
jgi:predicted RNA methylase